VQKQTTMTLWKSRHAKGGFFRKVRCVFQISKYQKTKYSKSLSWTWNLNFLPITVNNKLKFQAQDSNLEYFFWKFGDLKNESHFLNKSYLYLIHVMSQKIIACWYQIRTSMWYNVELICSIIINSLLTGDKISVS
jgi:hypothetical protein